MYRLPLLLLPMAMAAAQGQRFERIVAGLTVAADSGNIAADGLDGEFAGHATVTLPARSDRTLIRYTHGALISDEPVVITADVISVRSGLLLRARGHVVVLTRGERLDASELDLYLKIADGEARGGVRLNGSTPERRDPRETHRLFRFPPDIWEKLPIRDQK